MSVHYGGKCRSGPSGWFLCGWGQEGATGGSKTSKNNRNELVNEEKNRNGGLGDGRGDGRGMSVDGMGRWVFWLQLI